MPTQPACASWAKRSTAPAIASSPTWEGFLLRHDAVRGLPLDYWIASAGQSHTRYDVAHGGALDVDAFVGAGTRLEYRDDKGGRRRVAVLDGDRLMAVLFVGPHATLPDGAWLASLFARSTMSREERRALLAGRPSGSVDQGQVVCACHGIREGTIDAAIAGGCASVASVGAATKAGTNCGACVPELAARLAAYAARAARGAIFQIPLDAAQSLRQLSNARSVERTEANLPGYSPAWRPDLRSCA